MSAKEDILEQLAEEFLIHRGYFVRHNVKFLPSKDHADFDLRLDSNHSDIDVLGFNPLRQGADRVWAVSCKSWQAGFNPAAKISEITLNKKVAGRDAWKSFRELTSAKWSEAFIAAVHRWTGQSEFTYVTAVTKIVGDRGLWENHEPFRAAMCRNPIKIIALNEMLKEVDGELRTTLAGTELGRTLQLFRAAGIKLGGN
jgi:hypothetical protein